MPVYEDAEDDGRRGRNWTGLTDPTAFNRILECSFNVLQRRRRWRWRWIHRPTGPSGHRWRLGGSEWWRWFFLHPGASKIIWSIIGVLFFYRLWFLGHGEHRRITSLLFFFLLFSFSLRITRPVVFSPGYFVQETSMLNTYLTWFVWVRIGRFFCIEDFDLVAIRCICKCSLFVYCKGYRSIVWQCLSYLIYIDKQP